MTDISPVRGVRPPTVRSWEGATVVGPVVSGGEDVATAPIEKYQLSFWAEIGRETAIRVNYAPRIGQLVGDPFLLFQIPGNGIVAAGRGTELRRGDAIRVSVRIDAATFQVDFQPSGVRLSRSAPVTMRVWFEPTDLELDGDRVVNPIDRSRRQRLGFWYTPGRASSWRRLAAERDLEGIWVQASLYHVSGHAISW